MSIIIQELHDSEINARFEFQSGYDGVFQVKIGDPLNGFKAEATVGSWAEETWFHEKAIELYPDSAFATSPSSRTL